MMLAEVIRGGIFAVIDYVALHVLTCLIPAFLLAGGLVAVVSKEGIMVRLGLGSARVVPALLVAFAVGWTMTLVFRREEAARTVMGALQSGGRLLSPVDTGLLALLLVSLLAPHHLVGSGPCR